MAKKLQKLLKIREAAEILNVNPETLRRWDRSGKLKAIIISPPVGEAGPLIGEVDKRGDRRYRKEEVIRLINPIS